MKSAIVLTLLVLFLTTTTGLQAADSQDKLAAVAHRLADCDLTVQSELAEAQMSPMLREIEAVVDSCRKAEARIIARFNAAADDGGALGAKAEIATLKRETRLQILRIQARHARLAGRDDLARHIEDTLLRMLDPADLRRASYVVGQN